MAKVDATRNRGVYVVIQMAVATFEFCQFYFSKSTECPKMGDLYGCSY